MTKYPEIFQALAAPFDPSEVKSRPQGGRQLSYVTARTVMNRLDNVLGPENWEDNYLPIENAVVCTIKITLPDGRIVTKQDAGGHAGMSDQGDDEKSGFSDAFKRAAVKFGVGRSLYRDGVPHFAQGHQDAPREPQQAPRANHPPQQQQRPQQAQDGYSGSGASGNTPRSGGGLFKWVKEQEQQHNIALLKPLNAWAKSNGFPFKMTEWSQDQVAQGHTEALHLIGGSEPEPPPSDGYHHYEEEEPVPF